MSQRCMCLAVLDRIRSVLSLPAGAGGQLTSNVTFDAQPAPGCGEWFYAVYAGEWRGDSGDADLQEMIGVNVTVTRRVGFAPRDRQGPDVWAEANDGLDVTLRKIVAAVHRSYTVLNAANVYVEALNENSWGFEEPLSFVNGGKPEPKGVDWFCAEDAGSGKFANAGVAQTLSFGRAKRVQPITAMT